MGDNGLSIADAMAIARGGSGGGGCGCSGGGGGSGWGSDWVLFLFFLMAMGGRGWGGFGGNGGGDCGGGGWGGYYPPYPYGALTRADITDGFNNQAVISKLDGLTQGQCDSTYAMTNTMTNGFHNMSTQLCNMAAQQADCCCSTKSAISEVRFGNERNTSDIIQAINAMGQRIIDNQTQSEMQALRTELQSAQLQLSNNAQTTNIISALRPFPQPAYITCSPYTAVANGNCGCGCYA